MLNSIQIRNYRILRELDVDGLSRINLIAGRNNSGKTSLLEAIFLLSGAGNPQLVISVNVAREVDVDLFLWAELFSDLDVNRSIEVCGDHASLGSLTLNIGLEDAGSIQVPLDSPETGSMSNLSSQRALTFRHSGPGDSKVEGFIKDRGETLEISQPDRDILFRATMLSSRHGNVGKDAPLLGMLRRQKRSGLLLDALRVIEPRLQSVEDISTPKGAVIMGDVGLPELVPLSLTGEGMTQLARIMLAIASSPGGVVLIDEVENGFHHSVLPKVWEVIGAAAEQFDVQVFATTHSYECIMAAHESLDADTLRLHRIEARDSGVRCVTYQPESIEGAMWHNMEVR